MDLLLLCVWALTGHTAHVRRSEDNWCELVPSAMRIPGWNSGHQPLPRESFHRPLAVVHLNECQVSV